MASTQQTAERMTADTFLAWIAKLGEDSDFELICGEVVAMSPERVRHSNAKTEVAGQLYAQLSEHACRLHIDGMDVRVSDESVFRPDLLLQCAPVSSDATFVTDPTIVIEILSPSTRSFDLLRKVPLYLGLPSLSAALLIDPEFSRALLYRHGRTAAEPEVIEGDAPTTIEMALPQGKLTLDLAKVFAAAA